MAAGQFSTSHSQKTSPVRRHFTVDQANRSLPLVTRVVRDIVNTHHEVVALQAKLEEAAGQDFVGTRDQLDTSLERLQEYVDELEAIGVELKDYESGLIDFPGRYQDREIYLCWRLGEENVGHWHELHTGFGGRKPVALLDEVA